MKCFNLIAASSLILLTLGCSTASFYAEQRANTKAVLEEVDNTLEKHKYKKVFSMDRPPIQIQKFQEPQKETWLDEQISYFSNGNYLASEIEKIVAGNAPIKFGIGVKPHTEVYLKFKGSRADILNLIGVQTNFGISASENEVKVQQFISKTYNLPAVIGDVAFSIGSGDSGSSATNEESLEGEVSSTGGGDGQHANIKGKDYNLTTQIKDGITEILKRGTDETLGYVKDIKGTSSIVVRTSPHLIEEIDSFVKNMTTQLEKEVELEIKVIQYQEDLQSEFGVDANITFENAMKKATLGLASPTIQDTAGDIGLGFEIDKGKFSGSNAFVKALKETGTVSVSTSNTIKASNFRAQEIDVSKTIEYVSETKVSYEGDSATPVVDTTKATVRDGVKMSALPTIGSNAVHLKLNGILTKFIRFEVQEFNGVTIKSPEVRQALINLSGRYEYNRPVIITHLRQSTSESDSTGFADVQTGNSGRSNIIDTIVLLTPRRILETR